MNDLNPEMLEKISDRLCEIGDTFRIRHTTRWNGELCTPDNKSPAMTVTKQLDGWIWKCHRCGDKGFIRTTNRTPSETAAALKATTPKSHEVIVSNVSLPTDLIEMNDTPEKGVPWEAYHWLWGEQITGTMMIKYGIGWSGSYRRVIIPVYNSKNHTLQGWIGREVQYTSKKERDKAKCAKYITQKQGEGRMFFTCRGEKATVFVEDAVSAIRVHEASGLNTVALLTTSMNDELILEYKDQDVYVWLDADAASKSVKMVTRMKQFGVNAHFIYTSKDPKKYTNIYISDLLNKRMKG